MSTTEPLLTRDDQDAVATVTMNRPRQMNLLSREMMAALQTEFDAIAADPSRIRVVILAGTGAGFCAGHDLKEIRSLPNRDAVEELFEQCSRFMLSIARMPQPVIARVQGAAAAAGCQLVAQCDLAVASSEAVFTTPGVTWGFFCTTPGVPLARAIHRKHALEMLLTGEKIDAQQAWKWGLVNQVTPPGELEAATLALARLIASKPKETLAAGKQAFYAQVDLGLPEAYALASRSMAESFTAAEAREGIEAFLGKRAPRWEST